MIETEGENVAQLAQAQHGLELLPGRIGISIAAQIGRNGKELATTFKDSTLVT